MKKYLPRLKQFTINLVALAAIFIVINMVKTSDMLATDGSVSIKTLQVTTLDGNQTSIDLTQKSLVYFFAPWCGVCRYSVPNLNALKDQDDIQIVIIALDYADQQAVTDFIAANDVQFPVYLGNDAIKKQFKILGYPSYYLIDSNGNIAKANVGYTTSLGLQFNALTL